MKSRLRHHCRWCGGHPPPPGWLTPSPLRDGWLGRSAFALTKRTCSFLSFASCKCLWQNLTKGRTFPQIFQCLRWQSVQMSLEQACFELQQDHSCLTPTLNVAPDPGMSVTPLRMCHPPSTQMWHPPRLPGQQNTSPILALFFPLFSPPTVGWVLNVHQLWKLFHLCMMSKAFRYQTPPAQTTRVSVCEGSTSYDQSVYCILRITSCILFCMMHL